MLAWTTAQTHACTSGCCEPEVHTKAPCPLCGALGASVPAITLESLLTPSALRTIEGKTEGWHFCQTPACEAVYFQNASILRQTHLRIPVGLKEGIRPAMVCYCFEWSIERMQEEIERQGYTQALDDIKHNMDTIGCDCSRRNPSGRCCLGDVKKAIERLAAHP